MFDALQTQLSPENILEDTSTHARLNTALTGTTTLSDLTSKFLMFERALETLREHERQVQTYCESVALKAAVEQFGGERALASFVSASVEGLTSSDVTYNPQVAQEFLAGIIKNISNWFKDRNKGSLSDNEQMEMGNYVRAVDSDIENVIEVFKRKTSNSVFNTEYAKGFSLHSVGSMKDIVKSLNDFANGSGIPKQILEIAPPTNRGDLEENFKKVKDITKPLEQYLILDPAKGQYKLGPRFWIMEYSGSLTELGYHDVNNYKSILKELQRLPKLEDDFIRFLDTHMELTAKRDQMITNGADKDSVFSMNRWITFLLDGVGRDHILNLRAYITLANIRMPYIVLSQGSLFVELGSQIAKELKLKK
jgi:hypothetical protein